MTRQRALLLAPVEEAAALMGRRQLKAIENTREEK